MTLKTDNLTKGDLKVQNSTLETSKQCKLEMNNRTKLTSLIQILHITDPTLPIGGFSHSNGLETYVQQKIVVSVETTEQFIKSMLTNNYRYNDGLAAKLAYEYTLENNMEKLMYLDAECEALKSPIEVRVGSQKLGTRLMKIYISHLENSVILNEVNTLIAQNKMSGHYAVIYGIVTALLRVNKEEAICAFLYNAAVGMVTNAVKLVPLGQSDGQQILFDLEKIVEELTEKIIETAENMHGVCNAALDIKCMQHEHLYSRLYMS